MHVLLQLCTEVPVPACLCGSIAFEHTDHVVAVHTCKTSTRLVRFNPVIPSDSHIARFGFLHPDSYAPREEHRESCRMIHGETTWGSETVEARAIAWMVPL